jgi:hypothetical protein
MPRGSIGTALGNIEVGGKVWFEEATGRITRTELRLGSLPWRREIATTFGRDRKLGIDVPVQMRIGNANGQMTGIMRYRDFRRFEVRTEESLKGVPAK